MSFQLTGIMGDSKRQLRCVVGLSTYLTDCSLYVSLVSGGADPSIRLWDLDDRGSELQYVYDTKASVDR